MHKTEYKWYSLYLMQKRKRKLEDVEFPIVHCQSKFLSYEEKTKFQIVKPLLQASIRLEKQTDTSHYMLSNTLAWE
jgi:hypothetical protein